MGLIVGLDVGRAKNKLTAVMIRKAEPGVYQDGAGLSLKKTESGGKWTFRYSFGGKRRDMGLGSLTEVSLSDARQARDRWQKLIHEGTDPISERERLKGVELASQIEHEPTLSEVTAEAFNARKGGLRDAGTRGRWMSPLAKHVLPKLGNRPIASLHQSDIQKALTHLWRQKPPTAKKAILRLGIVFRHARLMGLDVDPFTVEAAKHMLGKVQHQTHSIQATPWQDVPSVFLRLEGSGSTRAALRFLILTVARGMSVRGARFDEIEDDVWTIPAERMKGREGHAHDFRVPLSTGALQIIEECRSIQTGPYLFPSYRKGFISDTALAKGLNELREPGRPHGFRTSFRTWVQETNAATYDVAETALAHIVGNKVERSYARSDLLDQRRVLMQKWADHVTQEPAQVVRLR